MTDSKVKAYLNNHYSDMGWEEAYEQLVYLTNKDRGQHTTKYRLMKSWRNRTLGNMLARLDPVAFQCTKNDMS